MPLTPERWQVAKTVLGAALERTPAERPAIVAAACGTDAALRIEVEAMLAAAARAAGSLEVPIAWRAEAVRRDGGLTAPAEAGEQAAPDPARLAAALSGRYTLDRELGRGGMATVYLARDLRHRRPVALKVLHSDLGALLGPTRFRREIETAANLRHPHILPLFDSGEADGLLYYTMPYAPGETLRERLAQLGGPLPLAEAWRVLREVADALAHAHRHGVVHRDVKPANILLEEGHAVVADFGIARAVSLAREPETPHAAGDAVVTDAGSLTDAGTTPGTPAYMAPEQARSDAAVDHRADLYALGVVAYESLAGRHPFAGRSAEALLAAHLTEAPAPLVAHRPDVPPALAALVVRLLAKAPEHRPQSADEVLRALDGALVPSPRTDAAPSRATGAEAAGRSRRAWPLAVLVAVVALGAAALAPRLRPPAPMSGPVMLAVLPFESHGPPELGYFADGLTDAIAGKLAGLSGLGVIDQRSAAQYRNTPKPAGQIGEELGVDYLLEGVVRWVPDAGGDPGRRRAQIVPRLVRTRDATTLSLGEPVVVTPADPFRAQTEVAAQVAEELGVALAAGEARMLARRPTADPEAYDAYLRSRAFWEEYQRSSQRRDLALAEEHLGRALALDPHFAAAWAQLVVVRWTALTGRPTGASGHGVAGPREIAAVGAAADSAVRLDSTLAEAWTARTRYLFLTGDQLGGLAAAERALALAPSSAEALRHVGAQQFILGRSDSGRASMARAARLAPRSLEVLASAALFTSISGLYDETEGYADRMLALDPTAEPGHAFKVTDALYLRGDTLLAARRLDAALGQVRAPSAALLLLLPYARGVHLARFAKLTAAEAGVASPADSAAYYDAQADASALLGRPDRERAYRDSTRRALSAGAVAGPFAYRWRLMLAAANAGLGRRAEALEIVRALETEAAGSAARHSEFEAWERAYRSAQVYALLGDAAAAADALRRALALPGWHGPAYLGLDPKLATLRGHAAFERLLAQQVR